MCLAFLCKSFFPSKCVVFISCDFNDCRLQHLPSCLHQVAGISDIDGAKTDDTRLYLHTEWFAQNDDGTVADGEAETRAFAATLGRIADGVTDLTLGSAERGTPGVPPSSVHAFLRARPSTPVAVVTNHAGAYTNKYYHSRFDDAAALPQDHAQRICKAATLTARALYAEAARSDEAGAAATAAIDAVTKTISADCDIVVQLLDCLLGVAAPSTAGTAASQVHDCELAKKLGVRLPRRRDDGVFHTLYRVFAPKARAQSLAAFVHGTPRLIHDFLKSDSFVGDRSSSNFNATAFAVGAAQSYNGTMTTATLHAAVDPALRYRSSMGKFEVDSEKMASPLHARSRLWTESHWGGDPGRMRVYYVESATTEWAILVAGIAIAATTFAAVSWAAPRWEQRYKRGYFKDE